MTSTLGGLIKDYRIQKNLSQQEIAFAMGWKEPSQLSRIEQGKVAQPKKDMLIRLSKAMKLLDKEKNQLLYISGYLPTKQENKETIKIVKDKLENWKYPAILYDFSWRIIYENQATRNLYYSNETQAQVTKEDMINVLDINFSPNFYLSKYYLLQEGVNHFLTKNIAHYLDSTDRFKHLKWRKQTLAKLLKYKEFSKIYSKISNSPSLPKDDFDMLFTERMFPYNDPKTILSFYTFDQALSNDPRYGAEFFIPADKATFEYFEKHKKKQPK